MDWIADEVRDTVQPELIGSDTVFHYSIPVLDETGNGRLEPTAELGSSKTALTGGEVLISKLNPRKARVHIAEPHDVPTICSGEFVVLRPRNVEPRYLYWLLLSEATRQSLDARVQSVTKSQQRARPDDISKMWIDVAPPGAQRAIADYLDTETVRIDSLIDLRRAQAVLASAHTQAAVDLSLDLLDPWSSLRRLLAPERDALIAGPFGSQLAGDDLKDAGVAGVIDQQVIIGGSFDSPRHFVDEAKWNELRRFAVKSGDLLVSGRGTTGRVAVAPKTIGPAIIHPSVLRVRPDARRMNVDFLAMCLRWSTRVSDYLSLENTATTIDVIYSGTLRGVPIPVPSLADQDRVLRRVEAIASNTRAIEQAMRIQATLLAERRQALITAATAGQLAIPGVAA